jgi:hypothetical protein
MKIKPKKGDPHKKPGLNPVLDFQLSPKVQIQHRRLSEFAKISPKEQSELAKYRIGIFSRDQRAVTDLRFGSLRNSDLTFSVKKSEQNHFKLPPISTPEYIPFPSESIKFSRSRLLMTLYNPTPHSIVNHYVQPEVNPAVLYDKKKFSERFYAEKGL